MRARSLAGRQPPVLTFGELTGPISEHQHMGGLGLPHVDLGDTNIQPIAQVSPQCASQEQSPDSSVRPGRKSHSRPPTNTKRGKKGAGGQITACWCCVCQQPTSQKVPPLPAPRRGPLGPSPALSCPRRHWASGSPASGPRHPEAPPPPAVRKPYCSAERGAPMLPQRGCWPYQVVTGRLERVGAAHVEGVGAERLQHADVVETFSLQGRDARISRRPAPAGRPPLPELQELQVPPCHPTSTSASPRVTCSHGPARAGGAAPGVSLPPPRTNLRLRHPQAGCQGPGPHPPPPVTNSPSAKPC